MLSSKELEIVESLKEFTMSEQCSVKTCDSCLFKVKHMCLSYEILTRYDEILKGEQSK